MKLQGSRPARRPRGARRRRIALASAALGASAALALATGGAAGGAAAKKPPTRPDIVVIMSDDQTVDSVRYQSHVLNEIGKHGATFANSFVNYSLCCPSRSTFLTGLYAHNHHVLGNAPPRGGFDRFERIDANNDLPLWLQASGYYTGEVGKYLNGYGNNAPTLVPPGWNEWSAVSGPVNYYDYQLNENGTLATFAEEPSDYVDTVITKNAVDFIHRNANGPSPIFLYVAYKAPHGGGPHPGGPRCGSGAPEPPPRHYGQFSSIPLPEPPNFNEADVSDKPTFIQRLPLLTPARIAAEQTLYQCELESIQGVNDGVNAIVDALKSAGTLRRTLLVYTSDNGFFHGEHRIYTGKVKVYEPSIRVPLLMRGPGIPEGVRVHDMVINADLAPTIVDAAAARAHRIMNGLSILSDAQHPRRELGRRLLIEGTNFKAIRTQRYKYVQYDNGEIELYDEQLDPYELQNQANNPAYAPVQALLATELGHLADCRQDGCARLPRLEVKLHYRRARSRFGGPCARAHVTAKVRGKDRPLVTQSDFTVNGVAGGAIPAPPFQIVVPKRELDPRRHARVHVTIEMLDGRELTLGKALPPRCV
jgi:arylsulfatase A-like enzyme